MHDAVTRFFAAIERRDLTAVLACLSEDVSYANVPHPSVHGHAGVGGLLGPFLERCNQARWDVVSSAQHGELTFAERIDRFWIDGDEYAIECNGVYRVVHDRIVEVRDYVDLGVWRARLGDVLDRDR